MLKDGNLSVKIGGVEHVDDVHGLEWETTSTGDGAASFWLEPLDPFVQIAAEFYTGATVDITYSLIGTIKQLYKGWIISDPKTGLAGETKIVEVECGGVLEVAKWRQDAGFVYTDADHDQWFENPRNAKWAAVDISDQLEIRAEDGTKVPRGPDDTARAAIVGYLVYEGATYLTKGEGGPLNGVKRISFNVTTKLQDGMRAKLGWSSGYKVSREQGAYGTIRLWDAGGDLSLGNRDGGVHRDWNITEWTSSPGSNGAGYIVLMMWTSEAKGVTMKGDSFVRLDNVKIYTDITEKKVDDALLDVANFIDLHDAATTSPIGNALENLVARPMTDPVGAMNTFAQQADVLVKWGWWGYYASGSKIEFVAQPLLINPTTIRSMTNCYAIDASEPGVTWDVHRHPEDGGNWKGLRFMFSRLGRSNYPAGFLDEVLAPAGSAGWSTGTPFHGTTARILTVDFTSHNFAKERARRVARRLARQLGMGLSNGTCTLRIQEVHRWNTSGGETWRPAAYIKGGDFVECEQSDCGPLLVTRSHIDLDNETIDLDVGIAGDTLIEQLEAIGAVGPKKKKPRHRRHSTR